MSDVTLTDDADVYYSYDNIKTQGWLDGHLPGLEAGIAYLPVEYNGGYDSKIFGDGAIVSFDLCEVCLKWLVDQLVIPPNIVEPG